MRRLIAISLLCVVLPVLAQSDRPSGLQPIPEPPPPPAGMAPDPSLEPQVTIKKRGQETLEEFRINGKLYQVKVTPENGPPYFLVDDRGDGQFIRRESLDSGLRVPQWVLFKF